MNKHVLLVMKYLDDNNSVTAQKLSDNRKAAAANYAFADASYVAAIAAADYDTDYTSAANYAFANYAAATYAFDAATYYTKNRVDRYFAHTKENKQDYINEIAKNKGKS